MIQQVGRPKGQKNWMEYANIVLIKTRNKER